MIKHFDISELRRHIAWDYLFFAWGLARAGEGEKAALRGDAERLLDRWEGLWRVHATANWFTANSRGDDIIIEGKTFPMLRQQNDKFMCLADYVKPVGSGTDKVGLFATTTDAGIPELTSAEPYERMLAQTLADRLAEAAAEEVSIDFPGLRCAPGYPSMPDLSINFLIDGLLGFAHIGVELTTSGMMNPHASVSGIIFPNPQAAFFEIRSVGDDQIADYASRRGMAAGDVRRFIRLG
ncbi:MAG: 5-methyltetrahydrofolate--homocysteine methyltransferase [Prevotella sp.]|nr:5-methyltetrahydrofolate--homocysteine methyltransferase [Prevotella sp.]